MVSVRTKQPPALPFPPGVWPAEVEGEAQVTDPTRAGVPHRPSLHGLREWRPCPSADPTLLTLRKTPSPDGMSVTGHIFRIIFHFMTLVLSCHTHMLLFNTGDFFFFNIFTNQPSWTFSNMWDLFLCPLILLPTSTV